MHFNNTTYYSRTRFTGCLILLSVEGAVGGFLWLISDLVGSEKGGGHILEHYAIDIPAAQPQLLESTNSSLHDLCARSIVQ